MTPLAPHWLVQNVRDVGVLAPTDFAPVFVGWNVWSVWQKNDLDFEPMMIGISRDRRLRIWVEDAVRLGAPDAKVADPLDLKGGQVEILPGQPEGLTPIAAKEGVGGSQALRLDGPPTLRYVRFFNRGLAGKLIWPHDSNYLLDTVYQPSPKAPATSGAPPPLVTDPVAGPAGQVAEKAAETMKYGLLILGVAAVAYVAVKTA